MKRVRALGVCAGLMAAQPLFAQSAYITNAGANNVSVVSIARNTVTATVPLGADSLGVAVAPNGQKVWAGEFAANSVAAISTASNTVVASITGINAPGGVAVRCR